jgi:leucine-rich PPR motif-containing protein
MSRRVSAGHDRCLELERAAIGRARSGNLGIHDALKLFDELLLHARPASVRALNQLLSVVSRKCSSPSNLVVSRFNRMLRDCSNKVAFDLCTYSILIGCFCRIGHLRDVASRGQPGLSPPYCC